MKTIYLFLAEGFEETEAVATIDMLRRAGLKVITVSISDQKKVRGSHLIEITADRLFFDSDYSDGIMIILPGGMPGTTNLQQYPPLRELIIDYANQRKYLAAICAAPSVYGNLGLLEGKNATCYPGFEDQLSGANLTNSNVVVNGQFITSKGPGSVFDFGAQIIEILESKEAATRVKTGMLIHA